MKTCIRALGRDAAVELFASYGAPVEKKGEGTELGPVHFGVIGFVGKYLRGSILLGLSAEALQRTFPVPGQTRGDWVGELANQLLGRMKNRLLSHGIEIALTTPIVLRGFEISPVGEGAGEPERFTLGNGTVQMWVEAEVEPGFVLGPAEDHRGLIEGDLLLF